MTHNIFSAYSINFKVYAVVSHNLNSRTMGQFFSFHSSSHLFSLREVFFFLFNQNVLYSVRYISTMCPVNYTKHRRGIWVRSEFLHHCEKILLSQPGSFQILSTSHHFSLWNLFTFRPRMEICLWNNCDSLAVGLQSNNTIYE